MHAEIVTITPAQAQAMLETNTHNRPVKHHHFAALARDMERGDWQLNGDAIRINGDGSLIDGQHRLMACVLADVAFQTLLVSGLPTSVHETIDGGIKRGLGDRLALDGYPYSQTVAATVRRVAGIATGDYTSLRLTDVECRRILELHPRIVSSVQGTYGAMPGLHTLLASIHYIGTFTGHQGRVNEFVDVWRTGVPNYTGDPAHLLRDRYLKSRGHQSNSIHANALTKLMINAWLNFVACKSLRTLKAGDAPKIAGWNVAALGLGS